MFTTGNITRVSLKIAYSVILMGQNIDDYCTSQFDGEILLDSVLGLITGKLLYSTDDQTRNEFYIYSHDLCR